MKELLPLTRACPLFQAIEEQDLPRMLSCLQVQAITVSKGTAILDQGDPARYFGVLLSGVAHVVRSDLQGGRSIIAVIQPGELFAEAFACASLAALPAGVYAAEDSTALLFDHNRVLKACSNGCLSHSRLVISLLRSIADKNLAMNTKLEIVMQRTTREKVMAYLNLCSKQTGSTQFAIPFDRQGLADYLGVERTALSAELSRLQKDGVIRFHKNAFELLKN